MSRWLQSIGTALEKLDDGASQGVQALRETLAVGTIADDDDEFSEEEDYDDDDEFFENDKEDSDAVDGEDAEELDSALSSDVDTAPQSLSNDTLGSIPLDPKEDVKNENKAEVTVTDMNKEEMTPSNDKEVALLTASANKVAPRTTTSALVEESRSKTTSSKSTESIAPVTAATLLPESEFVSASMEKEAPQASEEATAPLEATDNGPPMRTPASNSAKTDSASEAVASAPSTTLNTQQSLEISRLQQTIDEMERRYRTDVGKLVDKQAKLEQHHKQQLQKLQQKHKEAQQQHFQQQETLSQQVASLQAQLDHANTEVAAMQRELDQAAENIQQERDTWKEERQELLEEQEQERQEWKTEQQQAGRHQDQYYQTKIAALEAQLKDSNQQFKTKQAEAAKALQVTLGREEAAKAQIQELTSKHKELESQLAASAQTTTQLQASVDAMTSSLRESQDRERAAELKLDASLEQHQHQMNQKLARQVELERMVQELGEALSRQQHSSNVSERPSGGLRGNRSEEVQTSVPGGQATGEFTWKEKYERILEEMDTLQVQYELSQQQTQALQQELTDIANERALELAQTQERQRQHDAALEALTNQLHRMETALKERDHGPMSALSASMDSSIEMDDRLLSLQRAARDADHAKQQVASLSDQIVRQQGTIDSYKSEILALKGRLQAANARADSAEMHMSVDMVESGSDGPYGPTPSKMRRRVKGGRFGRGFASRSMRATLGLRAGPIGSIQEQVGRTVDAFDKWLLDTSDILRGEPIARVAFTAYMALLHIWCFALVAFHTVQSEHADLGTLTKRHPSHTGE